VFIYFALITWSLIGIILPRPARTGDEQIARASAPNVAWIGFLCVALATLFELGIVVAHADAVARPFRGAVVRAPIALRTTADLASPMTSDVDVLLALAETACLFSLYRSLAGRRVTSATVACIAITAAAGVFLAMTAPSSISADLYAYLGYAIAPTSPYVPRVIPFAGDHALIDTFIGPAPPVSYYGPLWSAISRLAVAPFPDLASQLYALRAIEAVSLAAIVAVSFRRRLPFAVIAMLAVNPAVLNEWIVDGHNDLFGVAFLSLAASARKQPVLQVMLLAAAGLVKFPLVIVGFFVFADYEGLGTRAALAALSFGLCFVASYAFGDNGEYLRHLAAYGAEHPAQPELSFHYVALALALIALLYALVGRRRVGTFAWIWPAIAAFPAPWYDLWGLPYALESGSAYAMLIALPIVSIIFSWNETETMLGAIVSIAAITLPFGYALLVRLRSLRASQAGAFALRTCRKA
jgi:hypothetical protein